MPLCRGIGGYGGKFACSKEFAPIGRDVSLRIGYVMAFVGRYVKGSVCATNEQYALGKAYSLKHFV